MLRELLLRDLTLHRRVLLAAACLPLLFLGILAYAPKDAGPGPATMMMMLGLFLLALLPVSLQIRETTLGTLGDLLALPIARRELVRLRFLEGLLACLVFLPCHLLVWKLARCPMPGGMLSELASPVVLWILVLFLAYPLPFALRWGAAGLLAALCSQLVYLVAFAFLMVFCTQVAWLAWLFRLGAGYTRVLAWTQHVLGGPAATDFGIPLLLLAILYGVSVRVFNRVEA